MSKSSVPSWFIYSCLLCLLLAGLIAAFYGYVNWQGEKRWAETVTRLKARGEPTDWREVVPPAVPEAENFCSTPLLACLMDYTRPPGTSEPLFANPDLVAKVKGMKHDDPSLDDLPLRSSRAVQRLSDLKAWQAYYQKSKVFPQPRFPLKTSPASTVLTALNLHEKELAELIAASKRPEARFAVHYDGDPKFSLPFPHIGIALNLGNILSLRAAAYLYDGQSAKAWNDLQVLLKFQQAFEKEPILISHLVSVTAVGIMLEPIWEGLALGAWSNTELKEINERLGRLDFLTENQRCMRGENMFFAVPTFDYLKVKGGPALADLLDLHGSTGRFIFPLIPRGCYDMAKVTSTERLYERVLPLIDEKNRRYNFAMEALMETEEKNRNSYSPTDIMLNLVTPTFRSAAQKMVEIQADVDMARIACLLELYQRKHGNYPPDLESLKESLPHDIVNGNPYSYSLTLDGRYQLWGVGWNQLNDSGKVVFKDREKRRVERQQGDWLWAYPSSHPTP